MGDVILKGFDKDGECYAIKTTVSPEGNPSDVIVEVEATAKIKAAYKRQQSKFEKRKDWKSGKRN